MVRSSNSEPWARKLIHAPVRDTSSGQDQSLGQLPREEVLALAHQARFLCCDGVLRKLINTPFLKHPPHLNTVQHSPAVQQDVPIGHPMAGAKVTERGIRREARHRLIVARDARIGTFDPTKSVVAPRRPVLAVTPRCRPSARCRGQRDPDAADPPTGALRSGRDLYASIWCRMKAVSALITESSVRSWRVRPPATLASTKSQAASPCSGRFTALP